MTDDGICWYVARTRKGQELSIRDKLNGFGIRNFVPVCGTPRLVAGRLVKANSPLIPNMVFLKTTKNDACSLANGRGLPVFYIRDHSTGGMLVIPNKQMEDFIRVVAEQEDTVQLTGFAPIVGHKVRIVSGKLSGVEGIAVSEEQNMHVVVCVGRLLCAKVKVLRESLELIG